MTATSDAGSPGTGTHTVLAPAEGAAFAQEAAVSSSPGCGGGGRRMRASAGNSGARTSNPESNSVLATSCKLALP